MAGVIAAWNNLTLYRVVVVSNAKYLLALIDEGAVIPS
jgi:hypothetical protein